MTKSDPAVSRDFLVSPVSRRFPYLLYMKGAICLSVSHEKVGWWSECLSVGSRSQK